MSRNLLSILVLATIANAAFSINAEAVDEGDKLLIEIGLLSTNADTKLQINGAAGNVGTTIDFEDDLGFKRSKQINRINLRYRFTDKHSPFILAARNSAIINGQ